VAHYKDNPPEAVAELKQALALSEDSVLIKAELGYAYAAAGQRDEARKIIYELQAVSGESVNFALR
jgi:Flp pilus assembly protein TadD